MTLLAFSAVALVSLATGARAAASVTLDSTQARLLARSGIEYASARLYQDSSPRTPPTPGNQSDDWTFRDEPGTPLEKARNPSYAITEPYLELGSNGRYDEGADSLPAGSDWNLNGRFDAWSGRLRGQRGAFGDVFLLKVSGEDGNICVNAGMLDGGTMNGSGDPDSRYTGPIDDPETSIPYEAGRKNVRIIDTINSLGQALSSPGLAGAGKAVVSARPVGGYRSLEQLQPFFPAADWNRIREHLSIDWNQSGRDLTRFYRNPHVGVTNFPGSNSREYWPGYPTQTTYHRTRTPPWIYWAEERVPCVNVNRADRAVLQALFAGLSGSTLPPGSAGLATTHYLDPEDAGRVADFLVAHRPFRSHYDFFGMLDAAKGSLFPLDSLPAQITKVNLVGDNANPDPGLSPNRTGLSPRRLPASPSFPSFSWCSYDLPRWPAGAPPGIESRVERSCVERFTSDPLAVAGPLAVATVGTLPLSWGPPGLFSMESKGVSLLPSGRRLAQAGCRASVRLISTFQAAGQQDFENQDTHSTLSGGVRVAGRPLLKDRLQTYPRFPLDSCTDLQGYPWPDPATGRTFPGLYVYPSDYGTIGLMAYTGYQRDAAQGQFFYQPCWEVGQPLRKQDPSVAAVSDVRSNFANVVATGSIPAPTMQETAFSPVSYKSLPDEVLFPNLECKEGGSPEYEAAPPPVLTPNTLRFAWEGWKFPWFDGQSGTFRGGAVDFWGMVGSTTLRQIQNNTLESLYFNAIVESTLAYWTDNATVGLRRASINAVISFSYSTTTVLAAGLSLGSYAPRAYHRIIFVLDPEADRIQGHVDGIADPGLFTFLDEVPPANPLKKVDTYLQGGTTKLFDSTLTTFSDPDRGGFDRMSGTRLYAGTPFNGLAILARSQASPFYWNAQADPGGGTGVPSFISPLYALLDAAVLESAGWNGFVPAAIRDSIGTDDVPLAVELWLYQDPAGEGPHRIVPFPLTAWKSGGDHLAFKTLWKAVYPGLPVPRVGALRFRVIMDTSSVSNFNSESPVFDNLSVSYRSRKLLNLGER